MTEAERYEKTLYKGKKKKAKKTPQEAWMDLIAEASNSAPSSLQAYMCRLSMLGNVPRKEKQFRNFTSNSLNLRGNQAQIVQSLWKYLSDLRATQQAEQQSKQQQQQQQQHTPDETIDRHVCPTVKEAKMEKVGHVESPKKASSELTCKSVRKTVRKLLKKAPKRSMKIKALRSAVRDALGLDNNNNKTTKKKLKEMLTNELNTDSKRIKVDGKLVTLA
eukprot:CAMPEP_0116557090 /NCGR_PEP_ID=MMETSP0397-20121206/9046_1 /TAXON_ID=216820 /ORGANISM="Cyclophora tenuis, Strain ECT3854" /LENGTH=218 /DNA_ID=CAMNT_0004082507 /DNA_START=76 /DNA_END=732 /DNA_ORIENTATION=-